MLGDLAAWRDIIDSRKARDARSFRLPGLCDRTTHHHTSIWHVHGRLSWGSCFLLMACESLVVSWR